MKMRALCLLVPAVLAACSVVETRQIDQKKFETLFLIGKEVEVELTSESGPRKEMLRKLKAEASTAESQASSDAEKSMIRLYGDAASMLAFAETMRESELSTGKVSASDDPKSSARFRRIGMEKLKLAQQAYLGK